MYSVLAQWGKQDTVFTCPSSIIYKFYLPGATGQAPILSPVYHLDYWMVSNTAGLYAAK